MRAECEHGSLRRSCELCERDDTIDAQYAVIARLTRERDEARERVTALAGALRGVLDTLQQREKLRICKQPHAGPVYDNARALLTEEAPDA